MIRQWEDCFSSRPLAVVVLAAAVVLPLLGWALGRRA